MSTASATDAVVWTTFFAPFSFHLWMIIFAAVFVCGVFIAATATTNQKDCKTFLAGSFKASWFSFAANFGSAQLDSEFSVNRRLHLRIIIFFVCLVGNVVFISYREGLKSCHDSSSRP